MWVSNPLSLVLLFLTCSLEATITDTHVSVFDVDYRNTKSGQVCMLANFLCEIVITNQNDGSYTKHQSWLFASTEGSYCDREFISHLKLAYDTSTMKVNFTKIDESKEKDSGTNPAKYCDNCNVGTWIVSALELQINNLTEYSEGTLQYEYMMVLNVSEKTLYEAIPDLTHHGIEINRAYKCDDPEYLTPISLDIISVHNISSNYQSFVANDWSAYLHFKSVSVQPFLVKDGKINDPFLCKDLTLAHCLIIMVPLLYFFVMIMIYKCRAAHGGCSLGKVHSVKEEIYNVEKMPLDNKEKKLLTVNYKPISDTTTNTTEPVNNNYAT